MGKISPEKLEAMRSISVMPRGLPSKPKVREYRTEESGRVRKTKDEHGNIVTEHAKGDRQDVEIRPQAVSLKAQTKIGE
jgi:hypothetical protein